MAERSLADTKRRAANDHLLTATRHLVVASGLGVTMDQIAEAAGVSRRTLFRYFDSREQLIAAAFAAAMEHYGEQLPAYDGDLKRWLCATCEAAHRMNASFGPGYWELTSRSDLPPDLAAAEQRRRLERRNAMARIASTVWHAAGHDGNPPDPLIATVGAHLSPHFTAAVMTDVGQQWQTAAELAYAAIIATLRRQTAPDVAG